ncbi:MAG: hypothetical protein K6G71_07210 [Clostridiales bacterium]|nr:hypothetical protein [Clostridiales bacterium]
MNTFNVMIIVIAIVAALVLLFALYYVLYKRHINRALEPGEKPRLRLIAPYNLLIGLTVFLLALSVALTGVFGANMALDYEGITKRAGRDLASRTLEVIDMPAVGKNGEPYTPPRPSDAAEIEGLLSTGGFDGFEVIPVMGISSFTHHDYRAAFVYGVDAKDCALFGLESMEDDVGYMFEAESEAMTLQLDVVRAETSEGSSGLVAYDMVDYPIRTQSGLSPAGFTEVFFESMTPTQREDVLYSGRPVLFVTLPTLAKMLAVCLRDDLPDGVRDVEDVFEHPWFSGCSMYICMNDLMDVNAARTALGEQGCVTVGPLKETTDYYESMSLLFRAVCAAGAVLTCVAAVNVFLSVKGVSQIRRRRKARAAG